MSKGIESIRVVIQIYVLESVNAGNCKRTRLMSVKVKYFDSNG